MDHKDFLQLIVLKCLDNDGVNFKLQNYGVIFDTKFIG